MTNATKSLAVIFVILMVLTIAMKWSSGPEASRVFRSTLVNIDTSRVSRVVIDHPGNPMLTLEKENRQWQVSDGGQEQYPADGPGILRAIDELNNLSVNAVATRNPDKFTRYKVDSTGIKVSLYDGEQKLNSIFVGAPQRSGRRSLNNYVRLADENAVYSVEGFLRSTFSKKLDDWRDKRVWEVEQSNISRVDFLYPADSSFTIEKVDNQQWISSGDTLSQREVSSALSRLSSPRTSGFSDALTKESFGTEKYAIQIALSGGKQHRLRLKESPADTTRYIAVSPDSPYVFTFRKSAWDDNVLKSRAELLDKR